LLAVGVLSDEVSNGYSEPILDELALCARERGIKLISFVERLAPADLGGTRRLTTDLARQGILDGILVLPIGYNLSPAELGEYCQRFRPLPVCTIPDTASDEFSRVSVDNEPGMRAAIRHLVEVHGYRRIGCIRGPDGSDEAALRFRMYEEVLREHGIAIDPELVAVGNYTNQSGIDGVRLLFDERKLSLRALVCANDAMAIGAAEALRARGREIPAEVAVIGFDDIDVAPHHEPPLTTVRQPLRKLAREALALLHEQITEGREPKRRVLPSELVVRESCGCHQLPGLPVPDASAPRTGGPGGLSLLALSGMVAEADVAELLDGEDERRLLQALLDDIAGDATNFPALLRKTLSGKLRARMDQNRLQAWFTLIWRRAVPLLGHDPALRDRAEVLLHTARILVALATEHAHSARQRRYEDLANRLSRTSVALGAALDIGEVQATLAGELPGYGISACFVCVYEGLTPSVESARLVLGYTRDGRPCSPRAGEPFPTKELLPAGCLSPDPTQDYVVGPLNRVGDSPGYVVFERGPRDGFVYDSLLPQIGGAIERIGLLSRLLEEVKRREGLERERLERELAIATRIQTSVLPRDISVEGLEIAAVMVPATEVGGDYYDVIRTPFGAFIGIGDVAGHGLSTGLVMLMLQSVLSGLARYRPEASASDILLAVNAVLYDNVRERMGQDEHVTFTLFRYERDGAMSFAGAHEDVLVYRARQGLCEWIPTVGTWLAASRDIASVTVESRMTLSEGDLMLLYTDGAVEARSPAGEMFGTERLEAALVLLKDESAQAICDGLLERVRAFAPVQEDDVTLLVARRL
jgi:DNA-binding LacI/PurR family transcriptional regulator/serine phosphatase RsbU (regulator of sigma subunit)